MTTIRPDLDSAAAVLAFARDRRAAADRAEADVLLAAVTWAEQHPPESIELTATWHTAGGDTGIALAGPGAPLVAEFCIAEFAVAIGRSTDSGRALIADAVELKYCLPRVWSRVQTSLESWKARRIAQATLGLSHDAATYVDGQVAAFAHKIGPAQLDRLVETAIARCMPELALEGAEKAAERRHLTFHHQQVSFDGTTFVEGELDLADALDLDAAVSRGAEELRLCGSKEPLDLRRSIAAGELARRQLALDLTSVIEAAPGATSTAKPRQVVLFVHLSEGAIGRRGGGDLARLENHRRGVTADQVRGWCANPDTQVVVKPVIDLDDHIHVEGYEVPDRLAEQTGCATSRASSPGAPGRPAPATATTSFRMPTVARPVHATSRHCAVDIIGSRRTRHGPTPSSNLGRSSGRAHTATSSCATTRAHSMSPGSGLHPAPPIHRTSSRVAPDAPSISPDRRVLRPGQTTGEVCRDRTLMAMSGRPDSWSASGTLISTPIEGHPHLWRRSHSP